MPLLTTGDSQEARLKDFEAWIGDYYKINPKIQPIPNAAKLLNQYYWNVVNAYVRPLFESAGMEEDNKHHLINRFKIISITELTIMAVLPFDIKKGETAGLGDEEMENARFAWFCSVTILRSWDTLLSKDAFKKLVEYLEVLNPGEPGEQLRAEYGFRKEHLQFLATLDTRVQIPVLSNAQIWRMFYFAGLALSNQMN